MKLIKMCLNKTYSKVYTGKHLSDAFPIQNDMICFITIALEYTITRLQMNGTRKFLVYADDVNSLGENIHTTK